MKPKRFTVDARTVLSLGRDSIKDHITAVIELVKNSYDANASVVVIDLAVSAAEPSVHSIRITDNGCGMDENQIESNWLRIGFSEKLADRVVKGRRKLGEKGVGRLSADRLGHELELRSQARKAAAAGIAIEWDEFEKAGTDLSDVPVRGITKADFKVPTPSAFDQRASAFKPAPAPESNGPACTGTELLIRRLRQGWSVDDVKKLREELAQLANPFIKAGGFQVRLQNDLDPQLNGVIVPPEVEDAEIEAVFNLEKDQIRISRTHRKAKRAKTAPVTLRFPVTEFVHQFSSRREPVMFRDIGPVEIRLLIYSTGEGLEDSSRKVALEDYLDLNAGVKVYRDGVRVIPYGDPAKPEGDWLKLAQRKAQNRAGIARPDWRVEPSRVVGAVMIGRDTNPQLLDAASREGLIGNDAFLWLKAIMERCLRHLEIEYHNLRRTEAPPKTDDARPLTVVREFNAYVDNLKQDLARIERSLPKAKTQEVKTLRSRLESYSEKASGLRDSLQHLEKESVNYRGLATLGIAHASFGHEIQLAAGEFLDSANSALLQLDEPVDIPTAKVELKKAVDHGNRILTWGRYTLKRVAAKKRSKQPTDIDDIIHTLVSDLLVYFKSSSVTLKAGKVEAIRASVVPMDIESIVINLLTNAYDFSKHGSGEREVRIELKKAAEDKVPGYEITVGDTGPGVPKHERENIWKPLFTTKANTDGTPRGTGLGLSIVDSVVKDYNGFRSVDKDARLGGALFRVWIPLEK